ATAALIAPGDRDEQCFEFIDLGRDRLARLQKRLRGGRQRRPRCTARAHTNGESAAMPAGEPDAKRLPQAPDGILAFLSFRCLVTAKLLAAMLLATAPIDASRAADGTRLLIKGKTGKCLTIAGGTSPANNLEAVQFDCDSDPSRTWRLQ